MKKLLWTLSLSLASFCSFSQSVNEPYSFPVRPGTKAWAELTTYQARLNAYNVPQDVLRKMSTKALVETCLAYPEFRLVMTRNDLQQGYTYVRSIFNGFIELESRVDAGQELLKVYQQLNPDDIIRYETLLAKGQFSFRFIYLELLLAQKTILDNASVSDKKVLIQQCISNYQKKERLPQENHLFELSTPVWVASRVLDSANNTKLAAKREADIVYRRFVDLAFCTNKSILDEIINLSKQYANE